MKFIGIFVVLIFCLFISGCSVHYISPNRKAIFPDQFNDDNSGIIIGRVTLRSWYGAVALVLGKTTGRGISFSDLETEKRSVYIAGNYFFLRLPVGRYLFEGIGEPAGLIKPIGEGFKFTVEKAAIKYIGSFLSDKDLLSDSIIEGSKEYGVHPHEPITFYVVDEREKIIAEFQKKFPEYKEKEIIIDFMK